MMKTGLLGRISSSWSLKTLMKPKWMQQFEIIEIKGRDLLTPI